jgi:hypothetical protein
VVLSSIVVEPRPPDATQDVAQVQVETSLESLFESRPGVVYLVVTNTTDVPVKVTRVLPDKPKFVDVIPVLDQASIVSLASQGTSVDVTLRPREVRRLPYQVKVDPKAQSQTGKHLLLFRVELEWESLGHLRTRSLVASHEIESGALGESEILTVLGVPSFLLLPGVLIVLTVELCWRRFWPRKKDQIPTPTTHDFWLVAITLSLIVILLVPWVSRLFGRSRNILRGYSLTDIMWIWFSSVVAALPLYGLGCAIRAIVNAVKRKSYYKRTFSPYDGPLNVLNKLKRAGRGLYVHVKSIEVEGEERPRTVYLLEPLSEEETEVWVAPRMAVQWGEGATDDFKEKVSQECLQKGSLSVLLKMIKEGTSESRKYLTLKWTRVGDVSGPKRFPVAQLTGPDNFKGVIIKPSE